MTAAPVRKRRSTSSQETGQGGARATQTELDAAQAILCAGVACGLIGGVGALVMRTRVASRPG
jgi:hypothetical protein